MIIALASIALVLLTAPALTVRLGRRVHPADWTRWSFGSLVAGAVAAEAALVLFALPTVLRALGAHALVAACARMTGSLMPGGPVVGWIRIRIPFDAHPGRSVFHCHIADHEDGGMMATIDVLDTAA